MTGFADFLRSILGLKVIQQSPQIGRDNIVAQNLTQNLTIVNPTRKATAPEIEALPYLLDRRPQWDETSKWFGIPPPTNRPVCILVVGHHEDLPHMAAKTLRNCAIQEFVEPKRREPFVALECDFPLPWPDDCDDSKATWRALNTSIFDGATHDDPNDAKAKISASKASVALGFVLDADDWDQKSTAALDWIEEASSIVLANGRMLALIFLVVTGKETQSVMLQDIQAKLRARYAGYESIFVPPLLAKVKRRDLRIWQATIPRTIRQQLRDGPFDTIEVDLFEKDSDEKWMGQLWQPIKDRLHSAAE